MPTYISLVNWTQNGIENVSESSERLDQAQELATEHGGEMIDFYLTFGDYDIVAVSEFPDDETYAKFALSVASQGSVSTETLKAFPEAEYREIIGALGE